MAGNGGFLGFSGDGGLATEAELYSPYNITVTADGNLYIADTGNNRIRKVTTDGIITTVAGSSKTPGFSGDGEPATEAHLSLPYDIDVASDGTLYIADSGNGRIRKVTPNGIITTVAGNGIFGFSGDGGLATEAQLFVPSSIAISPDTNFYIADGGLNRIFKVESSLPSFSVSEIAIASENGYELYKFNANGRHLSTLDTLNGNVIDSFIYNDSGQLIEIEDKNGQTTTIERDGEGIATAIVAPFGERTLLETDTNGYLSSITNPASEQTLLTYSEDGLLKTMTYPEGGISRFTYDEMGLLIKDEDPAGGYQTFARNDNNSSSYTVTRTTAMGHVTTFKTEDLTTGGKRATNTFGSSGSNVVEILPNGERNILYSDGSQIKIKYGPDVRWGMQSPIPEKTTITTPGGLTFTQEIEQSAILSDPNNNMSLTTYTKSRTINDREYKSTYSADEKSIVHQSPVGREMHVQLDDNGYLSTYQYGSRKLFRLNYDTSGRLTSMTHGEGTDTRTTSFAYAASGNLETFTNPLGQTISLTTDANGRPLSISGSDGSTVLYRYDKLTNVTSLTMPEESEHTFRYNMLGLLEAYKPPDTLDEYTYKYNLDRQLTQVNRPGNETIIFNYNTDGRKKATILPNNRNISYNWNADTGALESIEHSDGETVAYTFDGTLPLSATWSGTVNGSVTITYNNNFQVLTEKVNNANSISFTYDADGFLTNAGALTLQRDGETGELNDMTLSSVTTATTRNGFGERISLSTLYNTTPLYSVTFSRDGGGRITTKSENIDGSANSWSYTYDNAGHLSTVSDGTLTQTYTYDLNGNRKAVSDGTINITGDYDVQDRMTRWGNAIYTYSDSGELSQKKVSTEITSYNYDALGNLLSVTLPNNKLIEYVVDGRGRRVGKKVDSILVNGFLYHDRFNPVAQLDQSGNVVSRFVYAEQPNVPAYMIKDGISYRIISDHLGNVRLVVNASTGVVSQRIDYDEFGLVILDTNPGFQPFGFAGGIYDADTGLVRFGFRDYDAETGRWTTKDRLGFRGGINLYAYVNSDPINKLDITGLDPCINNWDDFINAAAGWGDGLFEIPYTKFSFTRWAREKIGEWTSEITGVDGPSVVKTNSAYYKGGKEAGGLTQGGLVGAAGLGGGYGLVLF